MLPLAMSPLMTMAPPSGLPLPLAGRRPAYGIYFEAEPRYAKVSGIVVSVLASGACASFFLFRVAQVKSWRSLAWTHWLLLAIYFDSYLFVMASTVLHYSFSLNDYQPLCEAATLLCLLAYLSSKLVYMFLCDRAYTVWGSGVSRCRSKPYLIHFAVLTVALFGCWIVLIIFRFSRMENGLCIIGIQQSAMIGPVAVDVACNAYLTAIFTYPIYRYTVKGSAEISPTAASSGTRTRSERLLRVAKKSFAGCCLSLSSSIANLLALMLLDGEPAWLCLLCCKIDVLFNAVVLFWVTSTDSRDITSTTSRSKSDSARSRVTRLSFYTGWIRANMGQGPHPGRPFIIPQTSPPSLPLMGGGGGDGDGTTSSATKPNDRRAVIDTTATTTAAAAAAEGESSQTSKCPTKFILKPSSPTANDAAAARFEAEYGNEIWTGPAHVEAADLTAAPRINENEAGEEEEQPDPSEKSDAMEGTGPVGTDDAGDK